MADHLNVTFQVDRVITEIDAKQAGIAGEMDAHIGRWGGVINPWTWPNNPWQKGIVSIDAWNSEVARMRTYAQNRIGPVRTHVANYCGLSTTLANLTFSVSPTGAGKIKVNRFVLPIPSGSNWTGAYFKAVPIEVAALPNKGYRFDGWSGITGGSVASITPTGDLTVTANFIADAAQQNPIVINEICYNAATDFATGDWVELYNPNAAGVDLSGWQFKDSNDDNIFTFPPHTTIGPGAYLVLCEDKIMFHSFFPAVENYLGNMTFNLSNGGELIRLYDAAGTPVDSLTYDDASPWPVEPDGTGPSLELKNPGVDNALAGVWAASTGHGTPGAANSAYIPPPQISGWDVVVTHGVVGEISTTATDGYIESRVSGLRTMRVRFDRPMDTSITDVGCVSIVGAVWGDWSGMVASLTWESATQVRIDLTGPLPDKDAFTIGLSKTVLSADGIGLDGDRDVLIHVRIGDAAGDGDVDNGDVIKVRNFKGQAVNSITYRCDVNADGIIDDADLTEVINHRDPLSP